MATLIKIKRKNGVAYRVQFFVNQKRHSKTWPLAKTRDKQQLTRKQANNFKKQIESEIENYKAGFVDYVPSIQSDNANREKLTLKELTIELKERRQGDVEPCTIQRNVRAMNTLMNCLGPDFLVRNLSDNTIEQFKNYRLDSGRISKVGVNKDLVNIKTMLNDAANRGLIPENPIPKIQMFRINNKRLPKYYTSDEIIVLKAKFEGEMWLAFLLFIYTGARRCEICQTRVGDGRGLRWKDIMWMQDEIKVSGKGEEKIKAMHPILKKELAAEMRRRQKEITFDFDDLVVHYICDTVTKKVQQVLKKNGMYVKGRAVHGFRHTFATETLKTSNLRVAQEALDHKNISTTEIYTHVVAEEKKRAVAALPY